MSTERDAEHGAGPAAAPTARRRSPATPEPREPLALWSRVERLERQLKVLQGEQLDAATRYEQLAGKLAELEARDR